MAELETRDFLECSSVFTTGDFRRALGGDVAGSTVNNRLHQARRRGYLETIRPGLHLSKVGLLRDRLPDPFALAAKMASDSLVSYHSALELHGLAHSPFRRVTFLTTSSVSALEYKGYEFIPLSPPASLRRKGVWRTMSASVRRGAELVCVTSRERTVVDCFDRLRWSGGTEELLRSLDNIPSLDVQALLEYLDMLGSASAVARLGWSLFSAPERWYLGEEDRAEFVRRLGKGPYFLGQRQGEMSFVPEWRLYVPAGLTVHDFLSG
ncbi:MAG TPA: hypothetical protein VFE20_07550 [Thermoleophilia bacterium]|nr:hypothetical protein [Thermoleophilia bacterium]